MTNKRWHLEPWHDLVGNRLGWHWWRADEPQLFARTLDLDRGTRRAVRQGFEQWIAQRTANPGLLVPLRRHA